MTLHATVASCKIVLYISEHVFFAWPNQNHKIFLMLEMYLTHYNSECSYFHS